MDEIAKRNDADLMQFGRGGGRIATSLNLESDAGKVAFTRCFGESDGHLAEMVGQPICVCDYLIHDYVKLDVTTGEIKELFRFCVITKDGDVYECGSEGLLRSFKMLTFAYGVPPWPAGKTLVVKSKRLQVGHCYWFELA